MLHIDDAPVFPLINGYRCDDCVFSSQGFCHWFLFCFCNSRDNCSSLLEKDEVVYSSLKQFAKWFSIESYFSIYEQLLRTIMKSKYPFFVMKRLHVLSKSKHLRGLFFTLIFFFFTKLVFSNPISPNLKP